MKRPKGAPNQFWGATFILIALGIVFGVALLLGRLEGGPLSLQSVVATRFVPEFEVVTPSIIILNGEATLLVSTAEALGIITAIPEVTANVAGNDSEDPSLAVVAGGENETRPEGEQTCNPTLPIGWIETFVRPGDTLTSLAQVTETDLAFIAAANCLESPDLRAGDPIFLPVIPPTPFDCVLLAGPPFGWEVVIVRPGDTLFSLAVSRQVTVAQVREVNCLPTDAIGAGQSLYLPVGAGAVLTSTSTGTPLATAQATGTPFPTPTNTSTLTLTPIPSSTNTQTSTPAPTNTSSPVPPSPSPTVDPNLGGTDTPTPTSTAITPTETPTDVPLTETATPSGPTETPTDVPPSETPTDVPPTETPTDVPPTPTETSTPSGPTETPTDVPPTETPTDIPPTETPTDVPPTPTDTPTPDPSPSETPTATPTP